MYISSLSPRDKCSRLCWCSSCCCNCNMLTYACGPCVCCSQFALLCISLLGLPTRELFKSHLPFSCVLRQPDAGHYHRTQSETKMSQSQNENQLQTNTNCLTEQRELLTELLSRLSALQALLLAHHSQSQSQSNLKSQTQLASTSVTLAAPPKKKWIYRHYRLGMCVLVCVYVIYHVIKAHVAIECEAAAAAFVLLTWKYGARKRERERAKEYLC